MRSLCFPDLGHEQMGETCHPRLCSGCWGKTLEQEQDNASGRAVPDSRSLEVTLWVMGTNPSTSLGRQLVT